VIKFEKKAERQGPPEQATDNRFEQIRKAAAEAHKKSNADPAPRRPPADD
jgi:hypothetical protein